MAVFDFPQLHTITAEFVFYNWILQALLGAPHTFHSVQGSANLHSRLTVNNVLRIINVHFSIEEINSELQGLSLIYADLSSESRSS